MFEAASLPPGTGAELNAKAWPLLPVFRWLKRAAGIPPRELARTFNCGIGMVAVAHPQDADAATRILADTGETVYRIGKIISQASGAPEVTIKNMDEAWNE